VDYTVDLIDETFIAVPPERLVPIVADPGRWERWWPDQHLQVFMDRGIKGMRWAVSGAFVGSSEIWLEAFADGTIVHYYLRANPTAKASQTQPDPPPDTLAGRRAAGRLRKRAATSWKVNVWALKDEMESAAASGAAADVVGDSGSAAPPRGQS